jgi:hypothetical protein
MFRVVSTAARVLLPIIFGTVLLVACTRSILGALPAWRTGGDVPPGHAQVRSDGWTMTVPASWEWVAVFKPDSPTTVMHLIADTKPVPMSVPEQLPEDRAGDAELKLVVSRQSRDWADLDWVENDAASCSRCAPELRRERRTVDVRGRPGVVIDVVRADGSREWVLIVQNDCYIYAAHARLTSASLADMSEAVERALSSAALGDAWKLFGHCAWEEFGSYLHPARPTHTATPGGTPNGSEEPSAPAD